MSRLVIALGLIMLGGAPVSAQLAVRGETVHTMTRPALSDAVFVITGGKIGEVG